MSLLSDRNTKDKKPAAKPPTVESETLSPEQFAAAHNPPAEPAAPPAPPAPPPPPEPAVAAPTKFRVLESKKFYIGMAQCRFEAGQVINANHYMPGVLNQILDNLRTEPVQE